MKAPRLLATRTCETTKIPAGMQKSDLWSFRYTSEQKKSELIKNTKANDILWNLCFTYSKSVQGLPVATYRYVSMHRRPLDLSSAIRRPSDFEKVENFRLFSELNTKC